MKKLLLLSSAFVMMLAVSCGGGKNAGAKSVADKFVKAFYVDMDLEASRQYVTSELQDEFPEADQMSELEKHFMTILQTHAAAHGYKADYDASRSTVGEDSAELFYILTANGNPEWTGEGEVELEKNADGKWQVTDYGFDRDEAAIDFGF